jgi:hypothetical protein
MEKSETSATEWAPLWSPKCKHPAANNPVAVGEDGLSANAGDFHDFGHGVFVLRDQAHDKKPLASPVGLGLSPGFFDLLNNFSAKLWECSHCGSKGSPIGGLM